MAYLWISPRSAELSEFAEYDRKRSPDRFLYQRGERAPGGVPTFVFGGDEALLARLAVLPNTARLPLVAPHVVTLIHRFVPDSDVQVVPSVIESRGKCGTGFVVLNPLRKVHCIDYDKSRFTVVPGTSKPLHFQELHHREGCLEGVHLARETDYKQHLLVSAALRDAFLDAGIAGVEFVTPEEYVELSRP